mmetsp:Transcript_17204/g.56318  ORF Transcript_17204/g.56318 Transcript_17204/m.56318 type:complete len:220 (+) Transcript_17204:216-875(+)
MPAFGDEGYNAEGKVAHLHLEHTRARHVLFLLRLVVDPIAVWLLLLLLQSFPTSTCNLLFGVAQGGPVIKDAGVHLAHARPEHGCDIPERWRSVILRDCLEERDVDVGEVAEDDAFGAFELVSVDEFRKGEPALKDFSRDAFRLERIVPDPRVPCSKRHKSALEKVLERLRRRDFLRPAHALVVLHALLLEPPDEPPARALLLRKENHVGRLRHRFDDG